MSLSQNTEVVRSGIKGFRVLDTVSDYEQQIKRELKGIDRNTSTVPESDLLVYGVYFQQNKKRRGLKGKKMSRQTMSQVVVYLQQD